MKLRRAVPLICAIALSAAGVGNVAAAAPRHPAKPKPVVFHTSGTYRVPKGIHHLTVELWGAGGAGGNNTPATNPVYIGGGGGGQGAFVEGKLKVKPGQKLPVVVGTGGPISGATGANGTPSTFDGLVAAGGMGGGRPPTGGACSSGYGGAGGAAATVGGTVVASHAGIPGTHGKCADFTGQGGKGGGANDKTGKGKPGRGGDGQGGTRLCDAGTNGKVVVTPAK